MKQLFQLLLLPSLALSLSSCRYSNEFNGSFNGKPAVLSAFSKNVDRYCIDLSLSSGDIKRNSAISVDSVYDPNDFQRAKAFNTKTEKCSAGFDEYLVGTRSSKILGVNLYAQTENSFGNMCRTVYYQNYTYADEIRFEFRNKLSDQATGTFEGTGDVQNYLDTLRPVNYGPYYPCAYYPNPGYPYPPHGRPGFPYFVAE